MYTNNRKYCLREKWQKFEELISLETQHNSYCISDSEYVAIQDFDYLARNRGKKKQFVISDEKEKNFPLYSSFQEKELKDNEGLRKFVRFNEESVFELMNHWYFGEPQLKETLLDLSYRAK